MSQIRRETFRSLKQTDLKLVKQSETFKYLVNKSFIVYQTSPLQNVSFDENSLDEYESVFQEKLPDCNVQFSILSGLAYSLPSILIEVDKNEKAVYKSVLLTTSMESTGTLPLLLVLRPFKEANITQVNSLIENTFECLIKPLILNELQTFWLMGISLMEVLRGRNKSSLRLRCKLPIHISSEITVSFDADSLGKIWDSLFDKNNEILQHKTLDILFSEINCHIKNAYGIDISTSPIEYFGLKDLYLLFNSEQLKMYISKPEMIFILLGYLASDCIVV